MYPNAPTLRVALYCYDAFGNTQVSTPSVAVSAELEGLGGSVSLGFERFRGGTLRVYSLQLPVSWFQTASPGGSAASVLVEVDGLPPQSLAGGTGCPPLS